MAYAGATMAGLEPNVLAPEKERTVQADSDVTVKGEVAEVHESPNYSIPLEVYMKYAEIQRAYERDEDIDKMYDAQEKMMTSDPNCNLSQQKLDNARQLRRANFYVVFSLIVTDILGPSNAPYAISQLGFGPGIFLYILFGVFAMLGGKLLQDAFLTLDSNNYPVRTFSDLAARILGRYARILIGLLQFIQMIFNVGIITLSSGQALAQMIKSTADNIKLCFAICCLVWAILGIIIGQIRTLRNFSHIAQLAVWMNVTVCLITMVGAATGPPNYATIKASFGIDKGPVHTYGVAPTSLSDRIGGINQMVFAWGGATIFCELMAEMRRPQDFWKGMLIGESFIMVVYLFFGIFVYAYQGQFTYSVANQGISQYNLQTASNAISLVSGVFAAILYGNVGLKVLYQGMLVTEFRFAPLMTKRGGLNWLVLVILYWGGAYCIALGIPQVNSLVSLIGALCILQFSYVFPPIFVAILMIRRDASKLDVFDPATNTLTVYDKWTSAARWKRGITEGSRLRFAVKALLLLLALGGLTLSGLGLYGAITGIISAFASSTASSFGCVPPV